MTKWEYKIVWVDLSNYQPQPILNDHGKDGWELVAVDFSDKTQPEYTFKRPLPQTIEFGKTTADRQADVALLAKTKEANHEIR